MNHPIGSTQAFESIIKSILQVANTPLPVLLTGETGVGKGVFAHYLHQQSTRCDKPFHVVNCGSIAAGVLESELFGHEKGAFSGALSRRIGLLEHADGGTVLLDEINSATPELQVRLLDFIQLGSIKPVGSNVPIRLDVRLVFATNQPLEPLVAQGLFRADLFYRMHVFPIEIPPLRQRKADIPMLVAQLLGDYAQRFNISIPMIESEAMQVLIDYAWPGNVRQLENVVQRLLVSTSLTGKIQIKDLPKELLDTPVLQASPSMRFYPTTESCLTLKELEEQHIRHTLMKCAGNKSLAAKLLGINSTTLWRKLKESPAAE